MASCFRTVSNRLCCASYLKTPVVIHFDVTNTSPSKIKQCDIRKRNSGIHPSVSNNITNPIYCSYHSTQLQNSCFPLPVHNITSQDINTWYKRENALLRRFPPIASEAYNDTLLLAKASESEKSLPPADCGRPTEELLEQTFQALSRDLPRLFVKPFDWRVYHENIILENNIRGKRSVGLRQYVSQVALLKAVAHFKFAHVKFIVLKITKHPEEGTIKCRWRIQGISGFDALFRFWKFMPVTKSQINVQEPPTWYDGFSIYYVGSDGRIFKHVIDKMMPDDDKVVTEKPGITKLAMFLGLAPTEDEVVLMNILSDYLEDDACLSSVMLPLEKLQ